MKKILLVDDDAEFRSHLAEILSEAGYRTVTASSAQAATDRCEAEEFDIILLDYMMPRISGIDTLQTLRRIQPKAKVIMLTAFATIENAVDAMKKGASDYISKPFKIENILTTIRRVLEEARFEACADNVDFDRILGSLANPIRRHILRLLHTRGGMRLMEMSRELRIDDHTKMIFHLKLLREAGLVRRDDEKLYTLAPEGVRMIDCLRMLERRTPM